MARSVTWEWSDAKSAFAVSVGGELVTYVQTEADAEDYARRLASQRSGRTTTPVAPSPDEAPPERTAPARKSPTRRKTTRRRKSTARKKSTARRSPSAPQQSPQQPLTNEEEEPSGT